VTSLPADISIYDQAGGAPAFDRLAHALHERCVADPVLSHAFDRDDLRPDHIERLARYLGEACGGPATYSQTYGGESAMQEVHAGKDPEEEFFTRFLDCFVAALEDAEFPTSTGIRSAMTSYMDNALVRMRQYADHGSVVPTGLPMPHITWR
jgi:hemoglobin